MGLFLACCWFVFCIYFRLEFRQFVFTDVVCKCLLGNSLAPLFSSHFLEANKTKFSANPYLLLHLKL